MLKRIVADLEATGKKFILPIADPDAMQALSLPLKSLVSVGE